MRIFQAIDELEAEGELRAKVGGWQEQVAELEAKLREVETDYQAAAEAKEVARQEGQRLVEALQDWLQRRNLSPDLSPEGALEVVQLIRSAQDVLRARDEAEASWQVLMVEVNGFLDRLQVVLAGLGQPPVTPEGVFVVVAQLKATWERYQDLMDQLTAAQQSLEVTQEQYDGNQGIIDRLLAETNSEDIGDFYRNRRLFSEYSALRQRQEHLEIEIPGQMWGVGLDPGVSGAGGDPEGISTATGVAARGPAASCGGVHCPVPGVSRAFAAAADGFGAG